MKFMVCWKILIKNYSTILVHQHRHQNSGFKWYFTDTGKQWLKPISSTIRAPSTSVAVNTNLSRVFAVKQLDETRLEDDFYVGKVYVRILRNNLKTNLHIIVNWYKCWNMCYVYTEFYLTNLKVPGIYIRF